jgi:tripartite-type tricarboxylate transporter receptor subunit TctC
VTKLLALLLGCLACAIAPAQVPASGAAAPLVILVGGPAGTPGDVVARAVSGPLAIELGQPVVVENRPGAIGTVALAAVARARPDGLTLGVLGLQAAVAPSLLKSLPYDTHRDLAPVRQLSSVSNVLVVRADSALASLDDLLQAGRAGSLTYASGGNGTPAHLAGELFRQQLGLKLQHVPFNGAVAGVTAVLGGHVQIMFATSPSVIALINSGKLRALATSAAQRIPALPDVPTMAELGQPAVTVRDWHGLVAPASTPADTLQRIAAALDKVVQAEALQQRLAAAGLDAMQVSGPAAFASLIAREMNRWPTVIERAGITLQ